MGAVLRFRRPVQFRFLAVFTRPFPDKVFVYLFLMGVHAF
jgi:hypothetical protein